LVRALESKLEASVEELERMKAMMRENAGGGRAGHGVDGVGMAKKESAVRKMSDRSVLNPNMKRRRQKGIKLGD